MNFLALLIAAFLLATAAMSASAQGERVSSIGFPSVAAALEALRARSDVKIRQESGWTIITEGEGLVLWSFTPPGHPAYPAAVKRTVIQERDGAVSLSMKVLCQSSKVACDKLVKEFQLLNEQMRQSIERQPRGTDGSEGQAR